MVHLDGVRAGEFAQHGILVDGDRPLTWVEDSYWNFRLVSGYDDSCHHRTSPMKHAACRFYQCTRLETLLAPCALVVHPGINNSFTARWYLHRRSRHYFASNPLAT